MIGRSVVLLAVLLLCSSAEALAVDEGGSCKLSEMVTSHSEKPFLDLRLRTPLTPSDQPIVVDIFGPTSLRTTEVFFQAAYDLGVHHDLDVISWKPSEHPLEANAPIGVLSVLMSPTRGRFTFKPFRVSDDNSTSPMRIGAPFTENGAISVMSPPVNVKRRIYVTGQGASRLTLIGSDRNTTRRNGDCQCRELPRLGPAVMSAFRSLWNGKRTLRKPSSPSVRRQNFWDRERLKIRESLARLVCNVMRPADGEASGDWRLSVV